MNEIESSPPVLAEGSKDNPADPSTDGGAAGSSDGGAAGRAARGSASDGQQEASTSGHARPTHPSYWFLFVVSFVTMVLDLATKVWAERRLERPDAFARPVDIIPGYLDLILAKNRGGAWGLLQDTSESIRRPFFLLVSCGAIAFIVMLYRRLAAQQQALRWGLPLVLGGALGNLVDRIRYSYVIDFIHMHVRWGGQDHHWPTYNVADIAICVGVGLMALDMLGANRKRHDVKDAT